MRVFVTGASGFLGRSVVRAAVAQGHDILALVRPTAKVEALGWPESVEVVRGDLRQAGEWSKQLTQVDAVVHLAAAPTGDLPTQLSGTVVATENLLNSLPMPSLRRFVHVSSFSVYDYSAAGSRATVNETTPLEPAPERRDAYTITKVLQERLVTEACESAGTHLVVIRPGAIVGPGKDWGFGRVLSFGRFDLVFSPGVKFPLTYVDNCADAIVSALDAPVATESVFNIVDDDLPTYAQFHRLGRSVGASHLGRALYVPWFAVSAIGAAVSAINRLAFNGRAKVPEFLDSNRQQVRWRPMLFGNQAAKDGLAWSPAVSLRSALEMTARASA
ncbi:MAG TPA: NAD-dependent epimerase/dehydratase family protein [Sphingomicrobium sp.]|nr:NAD-dependent epimerase/dehydratase family protein [Sphingomicrobium sp.]